MKMHVYFRPFKCAVGDNRAECFLRLGRTPEQEDLFLHQIMTGPKLKSVTLSSGMDLCWKRYNEISSSPNGYRDAADFIYKSNLVSYLANLGLSFALKGDEYLVCKKSEQRRLFIGQMIFKSNNFEIVAESWHHCVYWQLANLYCLPRIEVDLSLTEKANLLRKFLCRVEYKFKMLSRYRATVQRLSSENAREQSRIFAKAESYWSDEIENKLNDLKSSAQEKLEIADALMESDSNNGLLLRQNLERLIALPECNLTECLKVELVTSPVDGRDKKMRRKSA